MRRGGERVSGQGRPADRGGQAGPPLTWCSRTIRSSSSRLPCAGSLRRKASISCAFPLLRACSCRALSFLLCASCTAGSCGRSAPRPRPHTPTPQVLRRSTRRRGRSRGSGWGSGEDDEWLGASRRRRGGARTSPGAGTHHVRLAAPPLLGGPVVLYGERGEHLPPAAPELRRVRLGERGRLELVQGVLHDPLLPGAHLQLELPLAVVEVRAVVGQRPLAHGQRRVPARPVLLGVQAEPRRYVQDDVLRTAGGGRGWTDGAGSARRTRMHLLFPPPLLSVFLTSPSRP